MKNLYSLLLAIHAGDIQDSLEYCDRLRDYLETCKVTELPVVEVTGGNWSQLSVERPTCID